MLTHSGGATRPPGGSWRCGGRAATVCPGLVSTGATLPATGSGPRLVPPTGARTAGIKLTLPRSTVLPAASGRPAPAAVATATGPRAHDGLRRPRNGRTTTVPSGRRMATFRGPPPGPQLVTTTTGAPRSRYIRPARLPRPTRAGPLGTRSGVRMPVGPAACSSPQRGPPLHRMVTSFTGDRSITPAHHAARRNATTAWEPAPDCPSMICEGCGANVDSAFCPSCGRMRGRTACSRAFLLDGP